MVHIGRFITLHHRCTWKIQFKLQKCKHSNSKSWYAKGSTINEWKSIAPSALKVLKLSSLIVGCSFPLLQYQGNCIYLMDCSKKYPSAEQSKDGLCWQIQIIIGGTLLHTYTPGPRIMRFLRLGTIHTRVKDISTPNFSTPSFNPGPFNPRLFNDELFNSGLLNHEFLNHGVEKYMVEKSGVERSGVEMSFNLLKRWHFNHKHFNPMVQKFMVENSGVETFMVEKSGVERSRF